MNFEKNRKDLLDTISKIRQTPQNDQQTIQQSLASIVVFGSESPFLQSLVETLNSKFALKTFSIAEDAITYCLDNSSQKIILDMDMPTDWKMATDVFTTVRMMDNKVNFVLCTKSPQSTPVATLHAQGAEVLCKPFGIDALFNKLKIS